MFDTKDTDFFELEEESFDNVIQEDITFSGNISTKKSFMIHGNINGNISSESDLVVDTNSIVNADIKADRVLIRGKVRGNVIGDKIVFVTSTGSLEGDVTTRKIVLEPGCLFAGKCTMPSESEEAVL